MTCDGEAAFRTSPPDALQGSPSGNPDSPLGDPDGADGDVDERNDADGDLDDQPHSKGDSEPQDSPHRVSEDPTSPSGHPDSRASPAASSIKSSGGASKPKVMLNVKELPMPTPKPKLRPKPKPKSKPKSRSKSKPKPSKGKSKPTPSKEVSASKGEKRKADAEALPPAKRQRTEPVESDELECRRDVYYRYNIRQLKPVQFTRTTTNQVGCRSSLRISSLTLIQLPFYDYNAPFIVPEERLEAVMSHGPELLEKLSFASDNTGAAEPSLSYRRSKLPALLDSSSMFEGRAKFKLPFAQVRDPQLISAQRCKQTRIGEQRTKNLSNLAQICNLLQFRLIPTAYTANILRFSSMYMHIVFTKDAAPYFWGKFRPYRFGNRINHSVLRRGFQW
jgi:hypothetical protein